MENTKEKIEQVKEKLTNWNEEKQKRLETLISVLEKEKMNTEIGSEDFLIAKENALFFDDNEEAYVTEMIKKANEKNDTVDVFDNYMRICDNINLEHYYSTKLNQEINKISDLLGFGDGVKFEEKLKEKWEKRTEDTFSIPIKLYNKRTNDVAIFNINIESKGNLYPILSNYDLTIKRSDGEEKTFNFKEDYLINAKQAIGHVNAHINLSKQKKMYAYLIDDYGLKTDISNKIEMLTDDDIKSKICKQLDMQEYKNEFMLNISDLKSAEGTLITNVIYVDCSGSNISEIEAPNADEIKCDECQFLEKVTAPNCYEIYCEDTPLLKEDNIEAHSHCNIDGLKETHQLKR